MGLKGLSVKIANARNSYVLGQATRRPLGLSKLAPATDVISVCTRPCVFDFSGSGSGRSGAVILVLSTITPDPLRRLL